MNIIPIGPTILVEPQEVSSLQVQLRARGSLLVIPEAQTEKPTQGKVLALGDGEILQSGAKIGCRIKVGDVVIYNRYAGTEVSVPVMEEGKVAAHKTQIIIRQSEVVGIIEP